MEVSTRYITNKEYVGASFLIRAGARLIDLAYSFFIGLVSGFVGGLILAILQLLGKIDDSWATRVQETTMISFAIGMLASFIYHIICEGHYGATIGKKLLKIQVIKLNEESCDLKSAVIRNLGWYIDALFFGAIAYSSMSKSKLNQRYGDVWAKTIVVHRRDLPDQAKQSTTKFFVILVVASAVYVAMLAIDLVVKGVG